MRPVLFMIQASASNTPKGKRHHEKSVGLGNTGCWSRGGLPDVSPWRVTGCDCSAYGDQPCGVVGYGIENSFQLELLNHSLLRGGRHLVVNLLRHEFVLVGCEVIYVCGDGRAPAHTRRSQRSEVVIVKPAVATELGFGCAVERIEADPKTIGVGSLYQRA